MSARSDSARHLTVPVHHVDDLCVVAPAPDLNEKMKEQFERLRKRAPGLLDPTHTRWTAAARRTERRSDLSGHVLPVGTSAAVAQRAASSAHRCAAPCASSSCSSTSPTRRWRRDAAALRGTVLLDGHLPHGSVKEYFAEVTGGLVTSPAQVVGSVPDAADLGGVRTARTTACSGDPMPGRWRTTRSGRRGPDVNFAPVRQRRQRVRRRVHRRACGPRRRGDRQRRRHLVAQMGASGASATWTATKIYAYLTIPEDAKIGVSAHELGHLCSAGRTSTTPTTPPRASATGASWRAASGAAGTRPRTRPPGARPTRAGST